MTDENLYMQDMEVTGSNDERITFSVEFEWDGEAVFATPHNFKCNGNPMMLSDFNPFDRELIEIETENERYYRDSQYAERYIELEVAAREQAMVDSYREK